MLEFFNSRKGKMLYSVYKGNAASGSYWRMLALMVSAIAFEIKKPVLMYGGAGCTVSELLNEWGIDVDIVEVKNPVGGECYRNWFIGDEVINFNEYSCAIVDTFVGDNVVAPSRALVDSKLPYVWHKFTDIGRHSYSTFNFVDVV